MKLEIMERTNVNFLLWFLLTILFSKNIQAQCDFGSGNRSLPDGWIINNQSAMREVRSNQDLEIALVLYKDITYRFQIEGDTIADQAFEVYVKTTVPMEAGKEEHHSEKQVLLTDVDEIDGDFILKNEIELRVFVRLKATISSDDKVICKGIRLLEKN